jgi:hypothetical protein
MRVYQRVRYFEKESRRRFWRELLTRDEAQRIAAILAKLPELVRAGGIDDFSLSFWLRLQRQLLVLVWFLVGPKTLKPTQHLTQTCTSLAS